MKNYRTFKQLIQEVGLDVNPCVDTHSHIDISIFYNKNGIIL